MPGSEPDDVEIDPGTERLVLRATMVGFVVVFVLLSGGVLWYLSVSAGLVPPLVAAVVWPAVAGLFAVAMRKVYERQLAERGLG